MNFKDLMSKMKAIDEGTVAECGPMMAQSMGGSPDNVTMNVSMNAQGSGGIRDLMNALKDIQDGPDASAEMPQGDDEVIVGVAEEGVDDGGFGSATTSPEEEFADVDRVVNPPSDDLAANKGDHRQRQTGLPRAQMEGLVSHLSSLYQEVKEAKEKEPEGLYSSKRHETDGQRVARLAKEKMQAKKKEAESK